VNINAKTIEQILSLQSSENIKENRLLILALSFLSAKATVIKQISTSLGFPEEEVISMVKLLQQHDIFTKKDLDLISRMEKANVSSMNIEQYDAAVAEVVDHLAVITGKLRSRVTDKKKKLVEKWLRRGHTVEDFVKVNIFFHDLWANDPTMEMYLRPETLYNGKFESNLELAENGLNNVLKYRKEIVFICKAYYEACVSNIQEPNEEFFKSGKISEPCSLLPLKTQKQLAMWLKKGYTADVISMTIEQTVIGWSNKPTLVPHITIHKITDSKFPDRYTVADRLLKTRAAKQGVASAIDWLNSSTETDENEQTLLGAIDG